MSDPIFVTYRRPLFRMPDWEHLRERLAHRIVKFGLSLVPEKRIVSYARDEMTRAGLFSKDGDYGGMLGEAAMDAIKLFSLEGHSGGSASISTSIFEKISRYEPLSPLTGADDEWTEVSDGWFQNRRCGHVFKRGRDGQAYDNEGRVFREPGGACFTSKDSRVPVTFPYTPKREYVDVPGDAAEGQSNGR